MELSDRVNRFALLLPDDLAETGGHGTLERPRFLLEMDFDREAEPGGPRPIRRLDLGLSLTGQNVWLQKAATVAWLYRRATLPEALGHPDMSALLRMLRQGVQSPLAAVVAATVLLKAGRTDEMKGWIAELADRFPYLSDGPVLFAEWRLQVNEEQRLPAATRCRRRSCSWTAGCPSPTMPSPMLAVRSAPTCFRKTLHPPHETDSKLSGTNSETFSASAGVGASSAP